VQNWKKRFWIHLYSATFVVAFVGYLTTLSVAQTIQRSRKDIEWMMNWKECGRKQSWLNFRYYRGICLDKLRKTTNKCQDNRSQRRDLNRGPLKYEAGLLTSRPRRSVCTPSWNSYTLSLCCCCNPAWCCSIIMCYSVFRWFPHVQKVVGSRV
jgi:hypothetical protein